MNDLDTIAIDATYNMRLRINQRAINSTQFLFSEIADFFEQDFEQTKLFWLTVKEFRIFMLENKIFNFSKNYLTELFLNDFESEEKFSKMKNWLNVTTLLIQFENKCIEIDNQ